MNEKQATKGMYECLSGKEAIIYLLTTHSNEDTSTQCIYHAYSREYSIP